MITQSFFMKSLRNFKWMIKKKSGSWVRKCLGFSTFMMLFFMRGLMVDTKKIVRLYTVL